MKKFIVLTGLALIATSPALARSQQQHHHTNPAAQNEPVGTEAFGAENQYGRAEGAATRGHIVVDGVDQGTDPDPRVRMQMQMDPPIGGSGN